LNQTIWFYEEDHTVQFSIVFYALLRLGGRKRLKRIFPRSIAILPFSAMTLVVWDERNTNLLGTTSWGTAEGADESSEFRGSSFLACGLPFLQQILLMASWHLLPPCRLQYSPGETFIYPKQKHTHTKKTASRH
jgi:hypothetical protein